MLQGAAHADSLLGSLCRESCWLVERARCVTADLERTAHAGLRQRLQRELEVIAARCGELLRLCQLLRRNSAWQGSLALALLEELCTRGMLCR